MRQVIRFAFAFVFVFVGLSTLFSGAAFAEEGRLPAPMLDDPGLSIHKIETVCNTYVLTCKKTREFVVVDPGIGITELVAAYVKTGHTLKAVWITHEHGDHVAGLGALAKKNTVPVLAHAAAIKGIAEVRANWKAWGMEGRAPIPPVVPDTEVAGGGEVKVGETTWKVLHLPGHSTGSVGFLLAGRVLVVGDVLFQGSVGRYDLPTSEKAVFEKTLGGLWDLPDAVAVLPGHGATTTVGAEKKTNRLFQDLARAGRGEKPIPRPWMGIQLDQSYVGRGIGIQEVTVGSPAEKAGLEAGDAILKADGAAISHPRDLGAVIQRHAVGDTIPLLIKRGDEQKTLQLTFGARPPQ